MKQGDGVFLTSKEHNNSLFSFLLTNFYDFLFLKWAQKKALLRSCKNNLKKDYKNWEKKNKRDKENSKKIPTFCFCSLGL
jgi:hypothetical protein